MNGKENKENKEYKCYCGGTRKFSGETEDEKVIYQCDKCKKKSVHKE